MSQSVSGSPSLKVMERQKRRQSPGVSSYLSGSPSRAPTGTASSTSSSRNGGGALVEPLYGSFGSGQRASSSARSGRTGEMRRADTGGSSASDFSGGGTNNSFLDASFVSAGRLNPEGGSYLRPSMATADPYGRESSSFRAGQKETSSLRSELYSREFAAAAGRTSVPPPSIGSIPPLESGRKSSDGHSERSYDAYGRELPLPAKASSQVTSDHASAVASRSKNLSAWTRPALEARVETLERLLAEQSGSSSSIPRGAEDRELSEHLQVTVRKNRELRAELEVTKNRLASLMEEREAFAHKLERDNEALQALLEEAHRAKEALGNCIKQLSAEKSDLAQRLLAAENEIMRLKTAARDGGQTAAIVQFDEVRGNIEDIAVINEGLKESLRQMQLKNPAFANAAAALEASTSVSSEMPVQ